MKKRFAPLLFGTIALLVLWGAANWMIAKSAKQYFDVAMEELATGKVNSFFEVEILEDEETFFGATSELKLIPTSGLLDANIEHQKFTLKRLNGPIFINRNGIQIGFARWELSVSEETTDSTDAESSLESFLGAEPVASVVLGFSENAKIRFKNSDVMVGRARFDQVSVEGDVNFANSQHELKLDIADITYRNQQIELRLPVYTLISKQSTQINNGRPKSENLTKLIINANDGELVFLNESKKIPFNVQSHGSLWLNNDTLSSDWQIKAVSDQSTKHNGVGTTGKSGHFKTNITLQFRELLASGFWHYLNNQSEIFSLLQQAEWAMEDIETPEQQDFLRSLFLDADRIKQSLLNTPLKPMLIAERSQLAANFQFVTSSDGKASQILLGGTAVNKANSPELKMTGQAKVAREMLNNRWLALLDSWSKKRWFRRYETEFESDITVRNERLLLNNFIVSVDNLSAELSQALTDQ